MNKTLKILIIFYSLLVFASLPFNALTQEQQACQRSNNELKCVLKYYPTIYIKNYDYFWDVLNQSLDKAFSCTSDKVTSDFLLIASVANQGADFGEFIAENIEELCITKPECFKRAFGKLNKKSRMAVKKRLDNPLFFESSELVLCYK